MKLSDVLEELEHMNIEQLLVNIETFCEIWKEAVADGKQ